MAGDAREDLRALGELGLLARLGPLLRAHTEGLPLGTGDDVAVTDSPAAPRLAWTMDTMVEGTHFRFWHHPMATPERLGRKLALTNLSDLASKGATPLAALLSFGAPGDAPAAATEEFFRGVADTLHAHGARLLGGDTVRAPQWTLSLALVGTLVSTRTPAARHRVRPGHRLYVTGTPGESAAGLRLLEAPAKIRIEDHHADTLLRAHLEPAVSLEAGRRLAEAFPDLAMMDLSDGLAKDAGEMARQSNVRLVIDQAALASSAALHAFCNATGGTMASLALFGGEDYGLLFTTAADPAQVAEVLLPTGVVATAIGAAEVGDGLFLRAADGSFSPVQRAGFEHFAAAAASTAASAPTGLLREELIVLQADLDDESPQVLGAFVERALAEGALDAHLAPLHMKKNRPGTRVEVLVRPQDGERFTRLLLTETCTLGVKSRRVDRTSLPRRFAEVAVRGQAIRVKIAELDGKALRAVPEFEDCRRAAAALGLPVRTVLDEARREAAEMHLGSA